MKRDDIMNIAKRLGAPVLDLKLFGSDDLSVSVEWLVRFADAIAEAEREECAKVCEEEAMRREKAAQACAENGEQDEVDGILSTAWQITVCAARIRARCGE